MAENNLKDYTINWAIFGLLSMALMGFAISFMSINGTMGFGGDADIMISNTKNNMTDDLNLIEITANELLNITSKTNPETSYLGSRDSVGTSYKSMSSAKSFFGDTKKLIGWVFTGDSGQMLLVTFAGLIAFLGFYFGYKFIRSGT